MIITNTLQYTMIEIQLNKHKLTSSWTIPEKEVGMLSFWDILSIVICVSFAGKIQRPGDSGRVKLI